MITAIVRPFKLDELRDALATVARSGDGRILLSGLEQAIRIRTGESGISAT